MNAPDGLTKERRELFDLILGRKGDDARLEPAISAINAFLPERLRDVLKKDGFEATFSMEKHKPVAAAALFDGRKKGSACALIGGASGPDVFVVAPFPTAGVIADMMLGGDPELAAPGKERAPTRLECDLIGQFADIVGCALQATLAADKAPSLIRIALAKEELRDEDTAEPLVAFDMQINFGAVSQPVTVAVTHHQLLRMTRAEPVRIRRPHPESPAKRNQKALAVSVRVTGSINLQPKSLAEIAALRPGNVIAFPNDDDANVRLKVKGRPLYNCTLGRQGANYAVCLRQPHRVMTEVLSGIGMPVAQSEDEDDDDE